MKLNVVGNSPTKDSNARLSPMPSQPWPRPMCNARIEIKGGYHQSSSAGLVLHVSHLHLAKSQRSHDESEPFI